jgi:mRNA interferase RelE/StbE
MSYEFRFSKNALKSINKLDSFTRKMVLGWIEKKLSACGNPRYIGEALTGIHREYWRYRIGDYRLICDIQDGKMILLAVHIGHRREVYRKNL